MHADIEKLKAEHNLPILDFIKDLDQDEWVLTFAEEVANQYARLVFRLYPMHRKGDVTIWIPLTFSELSELERDDLSRLDIKVGPSIEGEYHINNEYGVRLDIESRTCLFEFFNFCENIK